MEGPVELLSMKKEKKYLLVTGLISFLFFGMVFRITAFSWMSGLLVIAFFQLLTALLPILAFLLDKSRQTKTFFHSLIILLVFWSCYFASEQIKTRVEKSIERKTEILISKIEAYKEQNGIYPATLDSEEFKSFDFTSSLGSEIIYQSKSDSTFLLEYAAFDGGKKVFSNNSTKWQWIDD